MAATKETFLGVVEADAKEIWGELKGEVEQGALTLWGLAKNFLASVEPTVAKDLQAEIARVLAGDIHLGQALDDLESAVLNDFKTAENPLLAEVEQIGSTMFQVMIGLVLKSLPKE